MTRRRTATVAIPVYNGESHVEISVRSVLEQTATPTVLAFDNCSTDATADILRGLLPPESVRVNERNVGAVGNFNRAVAESQTPYFAWLGADDRMLPRFVEVTAKALDDDPTVDACLTAVRFIDPEGRPTGRVQRDPELASGDPRVRLRSYLRRPRWTEVYRLYRRDALAASPRFRDAYGADVLLVWWFLLRGRLAVVDEELLEYRLYPVKTADDTAAGLNPDAPRRRWLMTSLWRALWRDTAHPDVPRATRRAARRELLLCLLHRDWQRHIAWDYYLVATDLLRRVRSRLR